MEIFFANFLGFLREFVFFVFLRAEGFYHVDAHQVFLKDGHSFAHAFLDP